MGYESIPKLIAKLSLPLMLSMLIQALYNVVDSIFVARVSETALTAVSLAYPLQSLMIAFGIGTAVGVNSYLARKLGEKKHDEAEAAADNGLFLAILTWIGFAIFGLIGTKPFISLFTDDPELLGLTTEYATICLVFSFGIFIDIAAERIMQATGDSVHPMIAQSLGAITNIILDPVFIFGFNMSVKGAAIATVIGQIVSMVAALIFVRKNKYISLHLSLKGFRPSGRIIKGNLRCRRSYDNNEQCRHSQCKRHEFHPDCIHFHCSLRPRSLLQAPVIHLHACIRTAEWNDSYHRIQLWCRKKEKDDGHAQNRRNDCCCDNDSRLPAVPARPGIPSLALCSF